MSVLLAPTTCRYGPKHGLSPFSQFQAVSSGESWNCSIFPLTASNAGEGIYFVLSVLCCLKFTWS